jgi:hypothetical protein
MESLKKTVKIEAWEGPDVLPWEKVCLDVKKNAKVHDCLEIIEGTLKEPEDETTEEYAEWKSANTRAIILLSNTFSHYEESGEIVQLFTEEDGLNGNAFECWMELDGEFDDDGVYDRVVLESKYDRFYLKADDSPTRFITKLNNLRNKLKRVGCVKDDETFLYDIIKTLPRTGEYETVGLELQKSLRPREVLKKKSPGTKQSELDKLHPLKRVKEVKELLRMH